MQTYNDSKVVTIHLKSNDIKRSRIAKNIDISVLHNLECIGSAYTAMGSILRGLNKDEEIKLMPRLLGISEKDPQFEKIVEEYWLNIRVPVPATGLDGKGGGIQLECGFSYATDKDAKEGRKEAEKEAERFETWKNSLAGKTADKIRRFQEDFRVRMSVGTPINVTNYILYRYCLAYSAVALDIKFVEMSAKIRFYILDNTASVAASHKALTTKKDAVVAFSSVLEDRDKVKAIINVMFSEVQILRNKENKDYPIDTTEEQDILLYELVNNYPAKFLVLNADEKLLLRAKIEYAINADILRRIPHTDTIYFGDNTRIGGNVDEAIVFLQDEKNTDINQQIAARLKTSK